MLVQFVNNWMRKFLRQQNRTQPAASSNLGVLGIIFIQLFTNWTACSPITYIKLLIYTTGPHSHILLMGVGWGHTGEFFGCEILHFCIFAKRNFLGL